MLSRYSLFKFEPEKLGQEQSYLGAPDFSIELTTFSIFINKYKCLDADRLVGQKISDEEFSVTYMFHLELVAEAADRNPASKGSLWTLIKSCHSLIAFPKAANYTKLLFFIGSSEVVAIKPFFLWLEFIRDFKKMQ